MTGWRRAVATLVGVAAAGFLLWLAAQPDRGTTGGYWAAYGIVAGAGVVFALSQLRGRDGNPRAMLALGFLPVLVAAGWVLLATQPNANWFRDHVLSWSESIGLEYVVRDLGTWLGVLAFGVGAVLGLTLEPATLRRRRAVPAGAGVVDERGAARTPAFDSRAADEPLSAERRDVETVPADEPVVEREVARRD
jgi:hypothetical protein